MLNQLKDLVRELKTESKKLKNLITEKKAGIEEVVNLKVKFVVKLLQVIFKRNQTWEKRKNANAVSWLNH